MVAYNEQKNVTGSLYNKQTNGIANLSKKMWLVAYNEQNNVTGSL